MGIRSALRLAAAAGELVTPEALPASERRTVVGSAVRLNLKKPDTLISSEEQAYTAWQREAWDYYDAIGEVKYAFQLVGAVMSRLRLYGAIILDEDAPPVSIASWIADSAAQNEEERVEFAQMELSPPEDITDEVMDAVRQQVSALGSGHGGMSGLLRDFGINLSVSGECYLIDYKGRWQIYSTEEVQIRRSDKKAYLRKFRSLGTSNPGSIGSGPYDEVLPEKTFIGRIWRPHPRYSYEPDSSMLSLREACYELVTLQQMIRGVARSRMNAGILYVPDGLSAAASLLDEADADEDAFEQELFDALTSPITDETASTAIVPMVVRGPGELADKLKHISFAREADQWLVQRADRVLERIMQGIDVPKDLVTGLANVKYSNAVVIDESMYKSHIEPLALLLCDSLTTMFLRPAIKAMFPDLSPDSLEKLCIWYDPSEVVSRPDPASSANEGYDRYALSGAAWRRSHGFSNTDAPTEAELALRLAVEKTTIPPDLAAALVKAAVPHVFEREREANIAAMPVPFPDSARDLLYGESDLEDPQDPLTQTIDQGLEQDDLEVQPLDETDLPTINLDEES